MRRKVKMTPRSRKSVAGTAGHWRILLATLMTLLAALSLVCGGASAASHRKKKKQTLSCHVVHRRHHKVKVCKKVTKKKKHKPAKKHKPTKKQTTTTPTTTTPTTALTGLAATKVIFDSGGNLYQVNGLGQGRTALTTDGSATSDNPQYIEPSLSADGTKLVFQGPDSQVFVANPDAITSTMKQLTGPSDDDPGMYPRISADGTQATWTETFLLEVGGQLTNYTQNTDGSNLNWYYTTGGIDGFGPNGTLLCNNSWVFNQLVVGSGSQVPDSCPTVVADESAISNARFGTRPAFSPDGTLVADSYNIWPSDTMNGIFLYSTSTGQLVRQLTNVPGDDYPVFSPDGTEILFNRGSDIYEVPTAGGAATLFQANG